MVCNADLVRPPPEVIAQSRAWRNISPTPDARGKRRPQGSLEWPALKRALDRHDPGYRN